MWYKLIILILISLMFILYGVYGLWKSINSGYRYDFWQDLKIALTRPRWGISNIYREDEPSRIMPGLYVLIGLVILSIGTAKMLYRLIVG